MSGRASSTAFVVGVAGTWNAGNFGPVARSIVEEFGITLGQVGLGSGTFFFLGVVAAGLGGTEISRRISIVTGLRIAFVLCLAGNIVIALSPCSRRSAPTGGSRSP